MKRIGVLGTGEVGRTLAGGLAAAGYDVMIGTRDPKRGAIQAWLQGEGSGVSVGTFRESAAHGDALFLAVGWPHVDAVIELAGSAEFEGKPLLDATNPLEAEVGEQAPTLALGPSDSAGETIQRRLPGAQVVKAFNIVGAPHMVKPSFSDGVPDMIICGDAPVAKRAAAALIQDLGWPEPIDLGGIEHARHLEALAMVLIVHFFNTGWQGEYAFKVLGKQAPDPASSGESLEDG
ncbi:MAG: NAD(P)-binding domain-containing protein [Pseudomonadota bacterium]